MEAASAGFGMGAACLLVTFLGAHQDGGDTFEEGGAAVGVKRKRSDQGVGGVADLAQSDRRIFPPAAAWSGGLRIDD